MNIFKTHSWGVHALEQMNERGLYQVAYFLGRPFGNHLIFPLLQTTDFQDQFFKAKGGIAFQLVIHPDRPTKSQAQLFSRFGAPIVHLNSIEDSFDENIRIIRPGEDYYDPDVEVIELSVGKALAIKERDSTYLFLASPFLLDRGTIRHTLNFKEVKSLNLEKAHIPWKTKRVICFFQFYRGTNWLDISSMVL